MRKLSILVTVAFAALALSACGSSNKNCSDACNKLDSCTISKSGVSCSATCGSPDDACAGCINDHTCSELSQGACHSACPNTDL